MPTMTERYKTDTPFSFRGFGTPAKKKKKVPEEMQIPQGVKPKQLPVTPGGGVNPSFGQGTGGFSLSTGPVDEAAREKRKGLTSVRGW